MTGDYSTIMYMYIFNMLKLVDVLFKAFVYVPNMCDGWLIDSWHLFVERSKVHQLWLQFDCPTAVTDCFWLVPVSFPPVTAAIVGGPISLVHQSQRVG